MSVLLRILTESLVSLKVPTDGHYFPKEIGSTFDFAD